MAYSKMFSVLEKAYPGQMIVSGIDYSKDFCVFGMNPKNVKNSQSTNWYFVRKDNMTYGAFNPGANFMGFVAAMNQRSFYPVLDN